MRTFLKNIFNLSKLYIIENSNILKMYDNFVNNDKKSIKKWKYIIMFLAIQFISIKAIRYTNATGNTELFLNGFLFLLEVIIIVKSLITCANVFLFSKDIENILHLPIKPVEIVISKFNAVLFMNYELEALIALLPIYLYQIDIYANPPNIFNSILALLIFPIFSSILISILTIIFSNLYIKIFKNKIIMKKIIKLFFILIVFICMGKIFRYIIYNQNNTNINFQTQVNIINNKIIKINNYFITVNPISQILKVKNFLTKTLNYIMVFLTNTIMFITLVFLGKKLYLKSIFKSNNYNKKVKKITLKKICKKNNKSISLVKKDFLTLSRNPLYFIYSIYPVILITVIISVLLMLFIPVCKEILKNDEYKDVLNNIKFNLENAFLCIGVIQFPGLFNYISITAFSREGRNAYIIKTIPIDLYKQFIYKSIPQVLINSISSMIVLLVVYYQIPQIGLKNIAIVFLLSLIITIINSFILCLIDLKNPRLIWNEEYEILKNNKNKLLQYILAIVNIVFLINMHNVLRKYSFNSSICSLFIILLIIFIVLNIYIIRKKNKLFNKIK